jgi:hypothetical protein
MEKDLAQLSKFQGAPAVSILLSTHRTFPDNKQDSIRLKNLLTLAEERMYALYEKREVWPILEKLKAEEASIDPNYNLDSLAVYASPSMTKVFKLPVGVTDRVVVGEHFEIRPILKAQQQTEHYYILSITKNKVRLLLGLNDKIEKEIHNEDFPYLNIHHTTDNVKLQEADVVDGLLKEFFNTADKRFKKYYYENPLPLILLGDERNIAFYQEQMDIKGLVIGTASGSYDEASDHHLVQVTQPLIKKYLEEQQEKALGDIALAQGKQLLLVDLTDIYRAAADGRAATLYIEKNYFQPGTIDEGVITLSTDPSSEDVTLQIIDNVIEKGGNVVFMEGNTLNEFNGIALATRY